MSNYLNTLFFFLICFCLQINSSLGLQNSPSQNIQKDSENPDVLQFGKVASFPMGVSMLELSTRPWLYYLSQKYKRQIQKLSDIPIQEFQRIKDMGMDYVWMMGMWQLGEYGLHYDQTNSDLLQQYSQTLPGYTMADIIGSPYAVTEYVTNSQVGTNQDLANLRATLHSLGLKLMLDFVPNHSAVDAPMINNTDYYIRAPKGTNPPYDPSHYLPNGIAYGSACGASCTGWQDTAQINYWNPKAAQARISQLLTVAQYSDAIRCDMAYLLLNDLFYDNWKTNLDSWGWTRPSQEWWTTAIQIVKSKYPNVVFLAEVYYPWQQQTQAVGFDYTYDKQIYDRLGNNDLNGLRGWITGQSLSFHQHSAHFISNHDQERAAQYFGSWWRADAASLVTFTLPGMKFFWMWEFEGFKNRLLVQLRREEAEAAISDTEQFYNTYLKILKDPVFSQGTWTYMNPQQSGTSGNLLVWRWDLNDTHRLCVMNFSPTQSGANIIVPNAQARNGNDTIAVTDLLSNTTYYRSANQMRTQGLFVMVNSWYAQIFSY